MAHRRGRPRAGNRPGDPLDLGRPVRWSRSTTVGWRTDDGLHAVAFIDGTLTAELVSADATEESGSVVGDADALIWGDPGRPQPGRRPLPVASSAKHWPSASLVRGRTQRHAHVDARSLRDPAHRRDVDGALIVQEERAARRSADRGRRRRPGRRARCGGRIRTIRTSKTRNKQNQQNQQNQQNANRPTPTKRPSRTTRSASKSVTSTFKRSSHASIGRTKMVESPPCTYSSTTSRTSKR